MREREGRSRKFAKRLRAAMTDAEVILWSAIRKKGVRSFKFRRQHPIGPYIADFACVSVRLVLEVDGPTYWTPQELEHDRRRTDYLTAAGWKVLRVTNADVYKDLDGVWLAIEGQLPPPAAAPPPPP